MAVYKPGVCNIGKKEVTKRYVLAFIGFAISALVVLSIILIRLPTWSLLILFIPLVFAFEGLYQGSSRFCAGFAAAGVYDVGGSKKKVSNQRDHAKDMQKAKKIRLYSIVSAIAIAAIVYLAS